MESQENEGITPDSIDWNACVVEAKKRIHYFYLLPNDNAKCYRFTKIREDAFVCTDCKSRRIWKLKTGCKDVTVTRKADDFSMKENPILRHLPCCEPKLFVDASKEYTSVTENQTGAYDFRLIKMEKGGACTVIHRLRNNPSKCYKLRVESRPLGESFVNLICNYCGQMGGKNQRVRPTYKINKKGFMDDPEDNHFPLCEPSNYRDIMKNRQYVNEHDALLYICGPKAAFIEVDESEKGKVWPIEVVASHSISFLYEIPNRKRCYQFVPKNYGDNNILLCRTCESSREQDSGSIEWKSDGLSLVMNPRRGHISLCDPPKLTSVLLSLRPTYEDGKMNENRKYEFPLVKRQKREEISIVYMIDTTKCYRFRSTNRSTVTQSVGLICSWCALERQKGRIKLTLPTYRCTADGIQSNPMKQHFPGCTPLDYSDVLRSYIPVDLTSARKFFEGKSSNASLGRVNGGTNSKNPTDDPVKSEVFEHHKKEITVKQQTDFPIHVIQKKNAVTFAYKFTKVGYIFYQLTPNDSSQLFCSTCLSTENNEPASDVLIRNSDGFSIEKDPTKHHLKHCKGFPNSSIFSYFAQDGQKKYEYSLLKRTKVEQFYVMYRMNTDTSFCYRFNSVGFTFDSGHMLVNCSQCQSLVKKMRKIEKENRSLEKSKIIVVTYRVDSSGFVDDPSLRHISDCEPLRFEDLMKEYFISGEQETRNYFTHSYSGAPLVGNGSKKMRPKQFRGSSVTVQCKNEEDNISRGHFSIEGMQNGNKGLDNLEETPVISQEASISCDDTVSQGSNNFNNIKVVFNRNMIFTKALDIPFFTRDEVKISISERTITISCKREVSALGVAGCSLQYSLELPPLVDVSSVRTKWTGEEIEIIADRM